MLIHRAQDFQALIQLSQPLRVVGDSLTGVPQRALRLVAVAHYHIGPHQPQPSLDIVTVLLQSGGETVHHAWIIALRSASFMSFAAAIASSDSAGAGEPPTRPNAA